MRVGPADLLQLVLQVLDHLVLAAFDLLDRLGDGTHCPAVNMRRLEHLVQL